MLRLSIEQRDLHPLKTSQLMFDHHGKLGKGSSFALIHSCTPFSDVSWENRHEILQVTEWLRTTT